MNKEFNYKLYKNTFEKAQAPDSLKQQILGMPERKRVHAVSTFGRVAIAAAALVICFVASNVITWAGTGQMWVITVSRSLFNDHVEKIESHMTVPDFETSNIPEAETTEEAAVREEIVLPESDFPVSDFQEPDQETDDLYEKEYLETIIPRYYRALETGKVFQFDYILVNDDTFGPVHSYEYVRQFTADDLKDAYFSEDYDWIRIDGENYYVKQSYLGAYNDIDDVLPDELEQYYNSGDPLDTTYGYSGDNIFILRIFSEKNWTEDRPEILAVEGVECIKTSIAVPISEGRVAIYSNEDQTLVRYLSEEECLSVEISWNGKAVRIGGEYYMITLGKSGQSDSFDEIHLFSPEGYGGDAGTDDLDSLNYYSLADFGIK